MRQLIIPGKLKEEFATVEALWNTTAETKRVDCLVLSWVKYEKQLRRLFSFLCFSTQTSPKRMLVMWCQRLLKIIDYILRLLLRV